MIGDATVVVRGDDSIGCAFEHVCAGTRGVVVVVGAGQEVLGTVTDASRAIIPGVSVSTENTQTGVSNTTITKEAGVYNFPSLQPGVYRVTAELPGFKKLINNGVNLEVDILQIMDAGTANTELR